MSTFEHAKPQLIVSFARNKADKIEIIYKHSPEDMENLDTFIASIRVEFHPHAIIFDQLHWQENSSLFFTKSKLSDVSGLYVENLGTLSRVSEDGTFTIIPSSSIDSIVTH